MMTNQEKKEIERVYKAKFETIDELSIPTFIRNRETLSDEAARIEMEAGFESLGLALPCDDEEEEEN